MRTWRHHTTSAVRWAVRGLGATSEIDEYQVWRVLLEHYGPIAGASLWRGCILIRSMAVS